MSLENVSLSVYLPSTLNLWGCSQSVNGANKTIYLLLFIRASHHLGLLLNLTFKLLSNLSVWTEPANRAPSPCPAYVSSPVDEESSEYNKKLIKRSWD